MIVFDTVNPGTKATNQGLKPGNVVEPCSVQGAVGISPPKAPESSSNHLQRDESFDRSPKMFKSSKSIELNGTNAKEKTGKGSDAKGGSIPSSPISITVSSSKKAGSGQMSLGHPLSTAVQNDGNKQLKVDESFPPPPADLLTKTEELSPVSPHSPRSPQAETTSLNSSEASTVISLKPDGVWSPSRRQDDTSKMEQKTETMEMKREMKVETETSTAWQVQETTKSENKVTSHKMETSTVSFANQEALDSSKTVPALPAKWGTGSLEGSQQTKKDEPVTKGPVSTPFTRLNGSSHLPRSQSPTITLLQKKREGQIPSGAIYIDNKMNKQEESSSPNLSSVPPINDNLFQVKSAEVYDDYRKIVIEPIQHRGIGPTNEQGIPVSLRTGIKEENKADWYKKMYKSLHRLGDSSEGRIPYTSSGYMSEPEPDRDDYIFTPKYATLDRRRLFSEQEFEATQRDYTSTKGKSVFSAWEPPSAKYSSDIYRNQPRKIEDYEPGHSSIAEREAKLDEDGEKHGPRTNTSRGILSHYKDGYESDSPLVYKRHGSEKLSSVDQKIWYREIQRGGDIPLTGLRRALGDSPKESTASPPIRLSHSSSLENTSAPFDLSLLPPVPAPPPKIPLVDGGSESPHKYLESEVNIHYKAPIRLLEKDFIEEEELKKKQETMMKQFYEDEKRKRFIQEMNDIESRRHSDNFVPNQKSPIPLDRYENSFEPSVSPQPRARTPEPKTVARALYNFTAQNARELSFSKSDIIIIRRRIDRNWYEGEHHGMVGLFPVNHVEIIPYDTIRATPKKLNEGRAKAKYHFHAQTSLELSLVKGEYIVLTRRVDKNWYMGRIGNREGIVPVSYLDIIQEPGETGRLSASPILKSSLSPRSRATILNGTATIHSYNQPNYYNQKTNAYQNPYATMRRYAPVRPPDPNYIEKKQPVDQSLHIDTQSEPIPYRALYDYQPQNEDELELQEGDTVFVMEKCDDGWYVGSSLRTGFFGTFPGNYVERMCK